MRVKVSLRLLVVLNGLLFVRYIGCLLVHVMVRLDVGFWLNVVLSRVNHVLVGILFSNRLVRCLVRF